jgi:hypothetical protein
MGLKNYLQEADNVKLVYGINAVVPMEYLVPILIIESFTYMDDIGAI